MLGSERGGGGGERKAGGLGCMLGSERGFLLLLGKREKDIKEEG